MKESIILYENIKKNLLKDYKSMHKSVKFEIASNDFYKYRDCSVSDDGLLSNGSNLYKIVFIAKDEVYLNFVLEDSNSLKMKLLRTLRVSQK